MNNPQVSPQVGIALVNRNLSEWADKSVFIVMLPDSDDQNGDHVVCDSYGHQFRRTKLIGEDKMPDDIRLFTLSEALHEIACYAWEHRAAYISHAELGVSAIIARKQSAEENVRPIKMNGQFVCVRYGAGGFFFLDNAEPTANEVDKITLAKHFSDRDEAEGHLANVVDDPEKWNVVRRDTNWVTNLEKIALTNPSAPAKSVMGPSEGA